MDRTSPCSFQVADGSLITIYIGISAPLASVTLRVTLRVAPCVLLVYKGCSTGVMPSVHSEFDRQKKNIRPSIC